MKKFPNRCWNTKTKLEKIKRIYKRVFSGFYCFPNKICMLRVNAKISFLELQLRKFNSFCSFFVCSISYRFYDYPEIFMKIRCFFPCQKLAACILDGYKSPLFQLIFAWLKTILKKQLRIYKPKLTTSYIPCRLRICTQKKLNAPFHLAK